MTAKYRMDSFDIAGEIIARHFNKLDFEAIEYESMLLVRNWVNIERQRAKVEKTIRIAKETGIVIYEQNDRQSN